VKHQKVYTRAVARIVLTSPRAREVVARFLERREIDPVDQPIFAHGRAILTVAYTVHGGYYSDFVRKLGADADDLEAEITGLNVEVERIEIPMNCPRTECDICERAVS
jgi:hypothetical protein